MIIPEHSWLATIYMYIVYGIHKISSTLLRNFLAGEQLLDTFSPDTQQWTMKVVMYFQGKI